MVSAMRPRAVSLFGKKASKAVDLDDHWGDEVLDWSAGSGFQEGVEGSLEVSGGGACDRRFQLAGDRGSEAA